MGVVLATTPNFTYASKDNRASAILEMKLTTFSNTNTVQYKVNGVALNTAYAWNTGVTIEQNVNTLMKLINDNTLTTDVSASLWWSNNASGTYYMKLQYGQPGNWLGYALDVYVNGSLSGSPGHQPKRALGYGTSKGNDIVGAKRYELSNHLGNVLSVISDRKWAVDDGVYNTSTGAKTSSTPDGTPDYYLPIIVSYSDYDPYGTLQDGRKGSLTGEGYRYGFQGQEADDEIKGEGNSYNYEYRMHDPRIGRFFAVDPLTHDYPWYTPYQFSGNKVTNHIELEGLEEYSLLLNVGKSGVLGKPAKVAAYKIENGIYKSVQKTGSGLMQLGKLCTPYASTSDYIAAGGGVLATGIAANTHGAAKKKIQQQLAKSKDPLTQATAKALDASIQDDKRLDQGLRNGDFGVIAEVTTDMFTDFTLGAATEGLVTGLKTKGISGLKTEVTFMKEIDEMVSEMKRTGQAPATVVGGKLPNGATHIGTSGAIPGEIAPSLEKMANEIGGVGTKRSGNTIGCCAEFKTGNQLLLEHPQFGPFDIDFTPAIRPRTGQVIPPCPNCQDIFGIKP